MLHQLLCWIKIFFLVDYCCCNLDVQPTVKEDHSDKEAISKFTSQKWKEKIKKNCHKTRTAQCNINLFTFSCLHEHLIKKKMNCTNRVCTVRLLHTIGSWNVDTTVQNEQRKKEHDYVKIMILIFIFFIFLKTFSFLLWRCHRLRCGICCCFAYFFFRLHYKNTTPHTKTLCTVHALMWDA